MPLHQYKMSFLDRLDFVVAIRDFDAADDAVAMAHAQSLCETHRIAVTQDGRSVGDVAKRSPAASAETATALPRRAPGRRR